jgi:hypothetical protein
MLTRRQPKVIDVKSGPAGTTTGRRLRRASMTRALSTAYRFLWFAA